MLPLSAFLCALTALSVLAQDATTTAAAAMSSTNATLPFFNSVTSGMAGSVVAVSGCDTTYQMSCTDAACSSDFDVTLTATINPSAYQYALSGTLNGVSVTGTQSCSLKGTKKAHCTEVVTSYHSNSAHTTALTKGYGINQGKVLMTAGIDKLASATACTVASQAAAAATPLVDVYKVLVVPAAAVLAGVLV